MELCNARPQTSHHLQQLLEIWHLGACKLWLNPTLQNKQSLKKNTRLNPERWQYVCYFGLCYQSACSYAQCTLWKGRNQQQDTQWTIAFSIYLFFQFYIYIFLSFLQCASAQQGPSLSRWCLACFTLASIWKNCSASASETTASSAPVISQWREAVR